MGDGLISRLQSFLKQPFQENGDVWNWVLFTGLIIILVILWSKVLDHIEPVLDAVGE